MSRGTKWLVGSFLVPVGLGVAVVVGLMLTGDARPEITEAQFTQVELGDSKQEVSRTLGDRGEGGSVVAGLDGAEAEETPTGLAEQFDDCWSYSVNGSGVGPGSEASVCFNSSDEAVFTRARID
jgi:hypothetical protein